MYFLTVSNVLVPPVPLSMNVAQLQTFLLTQSNLGYCTGDLMGHKCLSSVRALAVKENAITGKHVVGFPVVDHDPVGVQFGYYGVFSG